MEYFLHGGTHEIEKKKTAAVSAQRQCETGNPGSENQQLLN